MKIIAMLIGLFLHAFSFAQSKGVQFREFENWEAVVKAAKFENKNIFIDAYATWCGPCKNMDKEVYTNDEVGALVNANFISVKIQFDKAKNDNAYVKHWYNKAAELQRKYFVDAYPTLLFITPDGEILDKAVGFRKVPITLELARRANDPGLNFAGQLVRFKTGKMPLTEYPKLAVRAKELKSDSIANIIAREYKVKAIDNRSPEQVLQPELSPFLTRFYDIFSAKDKLVEYMYHNPKLADAVLKQKYAESFVGYLIAKTYIDPKVKQNGAYVTTAPDWKMLEKEIGKRYDKTLAEKLITGAQLNYYTHFKDWPNVVKYNILLTEIVGVDTSLIGAVSLNNMVYEVIFKHSTDRDELRKGIRFLEQILKVDGENHYWIDTYANILYKVGEKKRAIDEELRAITIAKKKKDSDIIGELQSNLKKMRNNEPTWIK